MFFAEVAHHCWINPEEARRLHAALLLFLRLLFLVERCLNELLCLQQFCKFTFLSKCVIYL